MADKMLIDASHEEETRVVVVRGNRIEEFDFESQHKKQLRGNIYLAKVTRVEPSLQAAFVDYGGNRHGFLAFSEIHPDYYQIPLADRQALLQAEAEAARAEAEYDNSDSHGTTGHHDDGDQAEIDGDEDDAPKAARGKGRRSRSRSGKGRGDNAKAAAADAADTEAAGDAGNVSAPHDAADGGDAGSSESDGGNDRSDEMLAAVEADEISEAVDPEMLERPKDGDDEDDGDDAEDHGSADNGAAKVESVGAEDALEELPDRVQRKPRRQYRIQEVIKRRQILLVQVVKEERGNKGAALTTYLSLAGRYSVLMPNTARGGGISRKITNIVDRKRLKEIARELEVPQGMGVILRTAGANRTRAEIKRDFEYLMRLWDNVRTLTLSSTAPTLVYEEGSLIKRSIRDLYNKDISEIIVSGEEGYREAKSFMKMLMPSHAKVVQPYRDIHPIFARSGIEAQLDKMLQPQVTLKSGGYIIINQTEALVAIDVNSGRSTKEHSIEDTALQTNLEAADEVARQLRLRDLAGLIVVDFIDMEEKRNNRAVEKRMKDALKNDRARIQVGRISHFGLLEMSRQRIRASVLESTTQVCEVCGGTGHVRSQSSVALHVLRGIEDYLLRNTTHNIHVRTTTATALYLLNQKRDSIVDLERRFGLSITIEADDHVGGQHFAIDRGEPVESPVNVESLLHLGTVYEEEEDDVVIEETPDEDEEAPRAEKRETSSEARSEDGGNGRKRKRRRRRRGGRGDEAEGGGPRPQADMRDGFDGGDGAEEDDEDGDDEDAEGADAARPAAGSGDGAELSAEEQGRRKRRRRGKRGGRRTRPEDEGAEGTVSVETEAEGTDEGVTATATEEAAASAVAEPAPAVVVAEVEAPAEETAAEVEAPAKPKRTRSRKKAAEAPVVEAEAPAAEPVAEAEPEATVAPAAATAESEEHKPAEESRPARRNRMGDPIATEPVVTSSGEPEAAEAEKPKKAGWWQRRGFF